MGGLAALTAIGGGLSAGGTLLSANAQRSAGAATNASYQFKAAQEEQAAGQSRAASQREMFDVQRKTALTQSALTARAAADGGSATDSGVLTLAESIAGQGAFNSAAAIYRGEDRARGLEMQAQGDRISGYAAKKGANQQAIGTLLSGAGSLFSRFGTKAVPDYG